MPTFAAVDIGSNSVRPSARSYRRFCRLQRGRLHALHEDREVTRLGEGVFSSGFLTPESISETVKVLRRFHRATQQVVTDSVRVVATSAMRDARNAPAFMEWVRSATGWKVEIISGVEEARLIHLGLVSGARIDQFPTLMLDLGGGSCELTVSQGGHIRDAVSLPLGAVRLTNEFLRHDPPRKGELTSLRGFVAREVNRARSRRQYVEELLVRCLKFRARFLGFQVDMLERLAVSSRDVSPAGERCFFQCVVFERSDHQSCPGGAKLFGDGFSNPLASAGDQRDLIFEHVLQTLLPDSHRGSR